MRFAIPQPEQTSRIAVCIGEIPKPLHRLTIYSYYRIYASMKVNMVPHSNSGPVNPIAMAEAADRASELLKSLGNRHRLLILCQLTEAERSVGELASFLDLRDSAVSQHL